MPNPDRKGDGSEVYYRDFINGRFELVKGIVLDHKPVQDANKDWDQDWNNKTGTILKIAPKDDRVTDPQRARYRRRNTVLTQEQYEKKRQKAT